MLTHLQVSTSLSMYRISLTFETPIQTNSCSPEEEHSNIEPIGQYIKTVIEQNPQTFRVFCPDQSESSNLSAVLEVTDRTDQSSIQSDDLQVSLRKERMLEFFSPHTCQGWLQGYLLTGRHGLFLSHEAALDSLISLMNQHASFLQPVQNIPVAVAKRGLCPTARCLAELFSNLNPMAAGMQRLLATKL